MPERCQMPDVLTTDEGEKRRVGVEIEISGLGYEKLVALTADLLGGKASTASRYVSRIDSPLGSSLSNWTLTRSRTWTFRTTGCRSPCASWAAMPWTLLTMRLSGWCHWKSSRPHPVRGTGDH